MGNSDPTATVESSRGGSPSYPIGSVGNALQMLLMLRKTPALRVTEVSQDLDIAPSSAHRILAVLQQFDFVEQDVTTRAYAQGPALRDIGLAAVSHLPVRQAAHQLIRNLRDVTGETTELCILDGPDVIVVDVAEGLLPLRVVDDLGDRMPAHLTAAGKAMLSRMATADLRELFPDPEEKLETVTERSIGTRALLDQHLATARELGYATNLGEAGPEFVGVAAAIVDETGTVHGAVTLALPWARAAEGFASHLGPQVRRAAETIGTVL
ncbi:IclR family transcriptional regulator [Rhodococcus koreensis]